MVADKIIELAANNAKIHIAKFGATFHIMSVIPNKNYFVSVTHPKISASIEESINTADLPENIIDEYVHCRIHGIAAKLISKLYPEK